MISENNTHDHLYKNIDDIHSTIFGQSFHWYSHAFFLEKVKNIKIINFNPIFIEILIEKLVK